MANNQAEKNSQEQENRKLYPSFHTDPADCLHHRQESDQWGISCYDCHKILGGYGKGKVSPICLVHVPMKYVGECWFCREMVTILN